MGATMKPLCFLISFLVAASFAFAGPESLPSGKETKEIAPIAPSLTNWAGLYIGVHGGGQFGHSETADLDDYYIFAHHHFGYSESGFNAGGQLGYNIQVKRFVFGPEFDFGYLNVDGDGHEPQRALRPPGIGTGSTDSDFYTTIRARAGFALGPQGDWLLYTTVGAIGVNYYTHFFAIDENITGIDASTTNFAWGYTVGGGLEKKLWRHWSIKAEYLYFSLDDQSFSGEENRQFGEFYRFTGETMGHIVRGGLNFQF